MGVCVGEEWGGERTDCFRHSGETKGSSALLGQADANGEMIMNKDSSCPGQEKTTYEHGVQMGHVGASEKEVCPGDTCIGLGGVRHVPVLGGP